MQPIDTRVGLIVDGDNRFFGRSAYGEWCEVMTSACDGVLVALGVRDPSPTSREALRLMMLGTMSPDARVWPLKLARLLASHGDPLVGYFGAQLVSAGKVMGPGAALHAARALHFIGAHAGEAPTDAAVGEAIAAWKARCGGRVGGFGVPFRAVDERRVHVLRLAAGTPIAEGRNFRLHEQVVAAMHPLQPNVALTVAAMLLDIGVAAEHAGVALAVMMSHVFLAHALEAAAQDGPRLHSIPADAVEYRGAAPRHSRTAAPSDPPLALRRAR
jgi:hypothetical protein